MHYSSKNEQYRRLELMVEMSQPITEQTTRDCPPSGVRVRNINNVDYEER